MIIQAIGHFTICRASLYNSFTAFIKIIYSKALSHEKTNDGNIDHRPNMAPAT
jgi:hypothetical protein